jgi:hypothetical protein
LLRRELPSYHSVGPNQAAGVTVKSGKSLPLSQVLASVSQAEQAALEAVGSGWVTWSGPENDRGAAWEVEITLPNGREIDLLVAPDGSIIR